MVEPSQDGGGTLLMQATYTYDVFNQRIQSQEWTSGTGDGDDPVCASDGNAWADLDGSSAAGHTADLRGSSGPGAGAGQRGRDRSMVFDGSVELCARHDGWKWGGAGDGGV